MARGRDAMEEVKTACAGSGLAAGHGLELVH